jgi:hypothetical protein
VGRQQQRGVGGERRRPAEGVELGGDDRQLAGDAKRATAGDAGADEAGVAGVEADVAVAGAGEVEDLDVARADRALGDLLLLPLLLRS